MMPKSSSSQETPRLSSPEEEIAYLREQVSRKERELKDKKEKLPVDAVIKERVSEYAQKKPERILAPEHRVTEKEIEGITLDLAPEEHDEKMSELLNILEKKGIRNTLSIVEKMNSPHIEDDFHRFLARYIKEGYPVPGMKEKGPLWKVFRMTLYEIALPTPQREEVQQKTLKELLSSMEQFYAGMLSVSGTKISQERHFTFEIATSAKSEEITIYASVPDEKKELFEKQILSIFPHAQLREQKNDYNVFVSGGISLGSRGIFSRNPIFPLKTYDQFDHDPLTIILNAFSKIEKESEGAALQIVLKPSSDVFIKKYKEALRKLNEGISEKEALNIPTTGTGEFVRVLGGFFSSKQKKKEGDEIKYPDPVLVENIQNKTTSSILQANIRLVASAKTRERAEGILSGLESAFNQFENTSGNRLVFKRIKRRKLIAFLKVFSFREFDKKFMLPLNIRELTTLMHLPATGAVAPQRLKQAKSADAQAPIGIPEHGTLLGVNHYQSTETKIYLTKEDRMRHFYVIGQTGTGKTTLLKNMISQDIKQGEGVCMIDPHGSDIVDILGVIPPEREKDIIYFDPAHTGRPMGLNMLEYDGRFPEQKTFVVNELFSIFQKLYGAVPESMGPMFEQYFRNAALLVLEDPESGGTLLDISRVLSDARFRALKLSRCTNSVVKQFWEGVAQKAGGEQALANIVPYITSKFDVFLANDIMRPIIAQERSAFNFRSIMDEKKILLVNLSKGRLGDINSNLIGLIIVGKILMAALSRTEEGGESPPFYLYIDEFQNVTTDSIAIILSEARKYKLSLTVAHQFIAQLEERIRDAVFGNVGSLAAFRVGADDVEFLKGQFEPVFSAHDLMNIDNRNAYVRLLVDGRPIKPFNIEIPEPTQSNLERVEHLKELSYQKYGRSREEIEREIQSRYS